MFEIVMLNKNNEKFTKTFKSYYLFEKFLNKVKYSKELKLISFGRV